MHPYGNLDTEMTMWQCHWEKHGTVRTDIPNIVQYEGSIAFTGVLWRPVQA